jgi:transcriptional regulator with XRE-family HTH domain
MNTGEMIKEHRLNKGLTQEELAEKTGISVRTIQRIENNEGDPRSHTLHLLAEALGIDFDLIKKGEKNEKEPTTLAESKFWLPLLHLSALFLTLIPTLLIWFYKKDQIDRVREHGIDLINFQLSMLMLIVPAAMLAFLVITIPILVFIGIISTGLILLNTLKVMNNQSYTYPYLIKFLKS